MQGFTEVLFSFLTQTFAEDTFDLENPFPADAHIRAWQTAEIKDPVKNRRCFRPELAVDILLIDKKRHPCLVKPEREIGLPQTCGGLCNGVTAGGFVLVARVFVACSDRIDYFRPFVPGMFKVSTC